MHRHIHRHREAHAAREFGFHGRGHGPGFGRGRQRRAERVFDQGDLRFVILKLISEAPRHGYEIIKEIEEKVGGAYSPSPGVIYPTLTLLEELGYVTVESAEGGKKLYRITEAGDAELTDRKTVVDGIFARMAEVRERYEGPSPRIFRAMQNLGNAIGTRMRAGPVGPEQLDALVAAIDEAARKVEKA
jgi:DNA-binding PadR family transcriptional regulator